MTFDERLAAVERLSRAAARYPRLYRFRVAFWILFGYALLFAIAAVALALAIATILALVYGKALALIKFAWLPLLVSGLVIRALFIRVDPPEGRPLASDEAPRFFALVEDIRRRLGVGRLTGVLLTTEINAAVAEVPRLGGLLGWRRWLVIGLPLLLIHDEPELRAILGHEFGHLSGRHGRLGVWAWRVRESWSRLDTSFRERSDSTAKLLRGLFHWYAERVFIVTIVQSRVHELGADRSSAELTSAGTAARALARVAVAPALLDREFWTPFYDRAKDEAEPSSTPWRELRARRGTILSAPAADLYERELARPTATDDSHPSLHERLAALGADRPEIPPVQVPAADVLTPELTETVIGELDDAWSEGVKPFWAARHEEMKAAALQVSSEVETTALGDETVRERAAALRSVGREEEALELLAALLERNPNDAHAAFATGSALVERGDLRGIERIAHAMTLDWRYVGPGCDLVYVTLRERGMEREAELWAERAREHEARLERAKEESVSLSARDAIVRSTLPDEVRAAIVERVRSERWISRAWLGMRELPSLPGLNAHFIAIRPKRFRYIPRNALQRIVDSIPSDEMLSVMMVKGDLVRRLDGDATLRVL